MAVERERSVWTLAAALAGCMVLSACSTRDAKPRAAPTSTTASTTSTTTVDQVKATIVSQWLAAQKASLAAARDPGNSALILLLSDYFADPELSFLRTQLGANAADGLKTVGTEDDGHPRVEKLTSTEAVVVTCGIDALGLDFVATGKPCRGRQQIRRRPPPGSEPP